MLFVGILAFGLIGVVAYWRAKQNRQNEETKNLNKALSRWENEGGKLPNRAIPMAAIHRKL